MAVLETINFLAGNESAFSDFIKGLEGYKKIVLVSHTDVDGIVGARVIDEAIRPDKIYFVSYAELNFSLVKKLKNEKATHVIFSDLMIKERDFVKAIKEFAEILIIDHHLVEQDWNGEGVVFLNAQDLCASYINYYLFSKVQNIEKIDWLVACACVADWCYIKNALWMGEIYKKYGERFVGTLDGIKESKFAEIVDNLNSALVYFKEDLKEVYNSVGEGFGDIGDLRKYAQEVNKDFEKSLRKFENEKIEIKDGYFWEFSAKYDYLSGLATEVSKRYLDKTIIVANKRQDYYHFSARRQDKKVSMDDLLKKLTLGLDSASAGGHVAAAGGHVMLKDTEEFKKRLKNL